VGEKTRREKSTKRTKQTSFTDERKWINLEGGREGLFWVRFSLFTYKKEQIIEEGKYAWTILFIVQVYLVWLEWILERSYEKGLETGDSPFWGFLSSFVSA